MTVFSVRPPDTSPEAFRVYWETLRRLGAAGRAGAAFDLSNTLHAVAAAGVRRRHPDYDEGRVRLAVLRLTLGPEAFRRAFPGVEVAP
jgi:hypothetical protein